MAAVARSINPAAIRSNSISAVVSARVNERASRCRRRARSSSHNCRPWSVSSILTCRRSVWSCCRWISLAFSIVESSRVMDCGWSPRYSARLLAVAGPSWWRRARIPNFDTPRLLGARLARRRRISRFACRNSRPAVSSAAREGSASVAIINTHSVSLCPDICNTNIQISLLGCLTRRTHRGIPCASNHQFQRRRGRI